MLREFFVKLGLATDFASFDTGFSKVKALKSSLGDLQSKLVSATRSMVRVFASAVSETAAYAERVDELSQSSGVGAEELQRLAYAGSFSGLSMEGMAHSMGLMSRTMAAAKAGSKEAAGAFSQLGVKVVGQGGKLRATDAVLGDLAEKFAAMPDGAQKTALAMKVFGRSGASMIPFLNAGREGLAKLKAEAPGVMSALEVKQGVGASAAIDKLKAKWGAFKRDFAKKVMPGVIAAANGLARALAFVGEHLALIGTIVAVTVGPSLLMLVGHFARVAYASVAAGWKMMFAGARAAAPWLALAAVIAGIALIIEDAVVGLSGGKSLIPWRGMVDGLTKVFEAFFGWLEAKMKWVTDKLEWIANEIAKAVNFVGGTTVQASMKALEDQARARGDTAGADKIKAVREKNDSEDMLGGSVVGWAMRQAQKKPGAPGAGLPGGAPTAPIFTTGGPMSGPPRLPAGGANINTSVVNNTTNVAPGSIVVNAAPGQSPADIGKAVDKRIGEREARSNRRAAERAP